MISGAAAGGRAQATGTEMKRTPSDWFCPACSQPFASQCSSVWGSAFVTSMIGAPVSKVESSRNIRNIPIQSLPLCIPRPKLTRPSVAIVELQWCLMNVVPLLALQQRCLPLWWWAVGNNYVIA